MSRVCRLIPNFAGDSFRCQSFQEKDNLFSKGVNLFSKTIVNHIRKKSKNCQPKLGKDTAALHVTTLQRYIW
jgi:hypothetical protein